MFVAPNPNIKVFGPGRNSFGREDIWNPNFDFKSIIRKEKIKRIFNVGQENK